MALNLGPTSDYDRKEQRVSENLRKKDQLRVMGELHGSRFSKLAGSGDLGPSLSPFWPQEQ